MTKPELGVNVRETSTVTQADGDVTELSSLCTGCLRESRSGLLLTYTDQTEGGKVFNRVRISGDRVSVERTGAVSLSLTLESGRTEQTVYRVPPFAFDMTVTTESVTVTRKPNGGLCIKLVFGTVLGGAPQATELVIEATPRRDAP